jgi:predicted transcriptional regulator
MAGTKRKSPVGNRATTGYTKDSVPETSNDGQGELRVEPGAMLEAEEASWFQAPNTLFDHQIQVVAMEREKGCGVAVAVVREIHPVEMLVYLYLRRCGNNGGQAFPSYATIASRCRITRVTAIRTVDTLTRSGLLEKRPTATKTGGQGSNHYFLRNPNGTPRKDFRGVVKSAYQGGSKMSTPPLVCSAYHPGMLSIPYKEPDINNQGDKQLLQQAVAADSQPWPSPAEILDLVAYAAGQEWEIGISTGYAKGMIEQMGGLDAAIEKVDAATTYIKKERRAGRPINSIAAVMHKIMTMETGGIKLGRSARDKKYDDLNLS